MISSLSSVDAAARAVPPEAQPARPGPGAGPPLPLLVLGGADGAPHVHARLVRQHPTPEGRLLLDPR